MYRFRTYPRRRGLLTVLAILFFLILWLVGCSAGQTEASGLQACLWDWCPFGGEVVEAPPAPPSDDPGVTDTPEDDGEVLPPLPTDPEPAPPAGPSDTGTGSRLDYQDDEAGGCAASADPLSYPACWLQRAQVNYDGVTPVTAIVAIQELAAEQGVAAFDGWETLEIDAHAPLLVWCPSNDCLWVPDSAFPLLGTQLDARWHQTIAVVQAHPQADPASIRTIKCPSGDCWAVPVE